MNSPFLTEMRSGAPCSGLIGVDEAPERLRKDLHEDNARPSDTEGGPAMRFAFLIHPISEQTQNLMALDEGGRLRNTWGRADLLRFCAEAHAAFAARSRPLRDGQTTSPRVVDAFDGLVSATGARA
jgi:hypothetical protein